MIVLMLTALIVLAMIGLVLWGIGQIPGIPRIVVTIIYIVAGVMLLLLLLQYVQSGNFNLHL
jgi:hypothetical protein